MAASRSSINCFPQQISFCSLLRKTQQAKAKTFTIFLHGSYYFNNLGVNPSAFEIGGWGFFWPLSFAHPIALPGCGVNAQLPCDGHFVVLLNIRENFNQSTILTSSIALH